MENNYFIELNKIDVNDKIEKKNGLSYLSWAYAWGELKKRFPNATYKIYENTLPTGYVVNYFTDGKTSYVKTSVTVNDIEHIEELPVMDYRNKSIPLEAMTSFDVNKAIQRSLTKAVARHGLGLYIYAGEDLPEQEPKQEAPKKAEPKPNVDNVEFATKEQIEMLKALGYKGAKKPETMTTKEADYYIQMGRTMKKGVKK
ncbi:MAG: DUF1071 domain-containing protein [Elusimicrobia bacterium]|nr:DUF1071 domain-containing protein [Elusimicrobiota bacterium]MBQ4178843.1 DUF1071 domain-containing protein [Elusimicrobiota bacterium]